MMSRSTSALARRYPELPLDELDDFEDEPTIELDSIGELVQKPAIVVELSTPLGEIRELFVEHRVPAIVVIDAKGNMHGIVTRTDIMRANDPSLRAADAMSGFVFTIPADASVLKAAALMGYEGVGQVVVTGARGAVLGMVSAIDIARYVAVSGGALLPR